MHVGTDVRQQILYFHFFLFAVGNAMAFVMPRLSRMVMLFLEKIIKRTALIFLIGLFLNWSPFIRWDADHLVFKEWKNVRILGVLQRIAIAYFFASTIVYYFKTKGRICILRNYIIILLVHYLVFWRARRSV
jgi:predicted acyltransferase